MPVSQYAYSPALVWFVDISGSSEIPIHKLIAVNRIKIAINEQLNLNKLAIEF